MSSVTSFSGLVRPPLRLSLIHIFSLLLVGVLALFSCEQEELDNFVESSGVGQVMRRAIGSSADFDPISELAEIPVNILHIGNSKQKYLTCKEKGTEICLTDKDDGSLRKRWYQMCIRDRYSSSVPGRRVFVPCFVPC